ncbi:hypothetical protein AAFF_G00208990 [Aldrovandia affinis]|uniref:Signal transducer and activator of transcription n=1 Tax=Aldrovandia affinis TaxID=143900 RepID=A0AAD7RH64_9TELE|nr:hypothetical protein AAFF_G00208990 [Aldrovandia affinis]
MSQWEEVQKLALWLQEQVASLYTDTFPWRAAGSDCERRAAALYSCLLVELEGHCARQQSLVHRHALKKVAQQLQEKYKARPLHMAAVISSSLWEERRIIERGQETQDRSAESDRRRHMDTQLAVVGCVVQGLAQAVKCMEDLQEDFDLRYTKLSNISHDPAMMDNMFVKLEVKVQNILNELHLKRKEVLSSMAGALSHVSALVTCDLPAEVAAWARRQQLACIGGPSPPGLDQLQNWFTLTVQSLFHIKRHLDKLGELLTKVTCEDESDAHLRPQMEEQVNNLITQLIKSSFVVELQPCLSNMAARPLVIKTSTQFSTKVRLLVKLPEVDYQLRVKITFDETLPPGQGNRLFNISSNNTKVMDVESSSGCLSAEFKRLELRERKATYEPRGNQSSLPVTEELHSICYRGQLRIQGLNIALETTSRPLVVISHVCQLPSAWASVMWCNMLTDAPENLSFFSRALSASWSQVSEVLSWQFSTLVGRGLNREQLSMLGDKLLGPQASNNDCQVTWSMFCKENLAGKSFSFWTWLDSILDLIKKHLRDIWVDGCIMGFVTKERAQALLKEGQVGTFLLRFSESHLGRITFSWLEQGDEGNATVHSVEPYTKHSLSVMSFADILREYRVITDGVLTGNPLKFLYPHVPFDDAFGKYGSPQRDEEVIGYVECNFISVSMFSTSRPPRSPFPELCELSPGTLDIINQTISPSADGQISLDHLEWE